MLVGRGDVLSRVRELVEAGTPTLLVGEAGIGKTTVLREVAAAQRNQVFWGGGLSTLSWMAYVALSRALHRSVVGDPVDVASTVESEVGDGLLVVDDLQWCDDRSLQALAVLPRRVRVLAAVRSDDAGRQRPLELARSARWTIVELAPLADDAAAALVRLHAPEVGSGDLAEIVRRASGNPLFLEHLARADDPIEGELGAVLAARLEQLPEHCRRAMAVLGLLGRPAPPALIGVAEEELRECGLVVDDQGGAVAPRHDLLASAAVAALPADQRRALHAWLAGVVDHPAEAAVHHAAAGAPRAAFDAAARALAVAASPGERAHALAIQATSSPLPMSAQLRLDAAASLIEAGNAGLALELASQPQPHDPAEQVRALWLQARAAWFLGDARRSRAAVDEGLRLADGTGAPEEVDLRIMDARLLVRSEWRPDEAVCAAREALQRALATGHAEAAAHSVLGSALLISGSPEWRQELHAARETARVTEDHETECVAADSLVFAEFLAGDPRKVGELCAAMIGRTESLGIRGWELQFRKNQAVVGFHAGADYREVVRDCRHLLRQPLTARAREQLEATLALALAVTGDDAAASTIIEDALARPRSDDTEQALLLWSAAEADRLAGRFERAVERAERCLALPVTGFPAMTLCGLTRRWALHELGRPVDGALEPSPFPALAGAAAESEALVLASEGQDGDAEARFLLAADAWQPFQRYAAIRCQWAAGAAAGRAGDPRRAERHLRSAESQAASLGCDPLLRRVHRAMRTLGIRVDVGPSRGARREVLDLVARGMTTAQIARRLALSTSTVNGHVRAAMRDAGSRTRLAAALESIAEAGADSADVSGRRAIVTADERLFDLAVASERPAADDFAEGWSVPEEPWDLSGRRLLRVGAVRSAAEAAAALHVAVRGASVVVLLADDLPSSVRAPFLDSLRRVAAVRWEPDPSGATAALSAEERTVLERLAAGRSVSEIAADCFISRRTVVRRLASARDKLGVRSNAEAVLASRRLPPVT